MRRLKVFGFALAAIICAASPAPGKTWSSPEHEAAISKMYSDPDGAEKVLAQVTTNLEKLDYALFLHAFRAPSPARDEKIRGLIVELQTQANAKAADSDLAKDANYGHLIAPIRSYDGSDDSLIPLIQTVSMAGIVTGSGNAGYDIPCGVLQRRPGLLEATTPLYGSSLDAFLPYSGCGSRGTVAGFPRDIIYAFLKSASEVRDFERNGTIRFAYEKEQIQAETRMEVDPRSFLNLPPPSMNLPYQTCSNRKQKKLLRPNYLRARAALTAYFVTSGLSNNQALSAATAALFTIAYQADCSEN